MFEGFRSFEVSTAGGVVAGVTAGSGPAVLLLHGIPQTHPMWRYIAPRLADRFTVVATDLRGYGASGFPHANGSADSRLHAMSSLAADQVAAMDSLDLERFSVVGHDRGARCAYRLALDHPHRIEGLAVMDIVPTGDAFAAADRDFALGYWVWSFLAAPWPVPEQLIAGSPDAFVDHMLDAWSDNTATFSDEVRRVYREQFHDPDRVHAICEQYRAAATVDVENDEADRGRKIASPVLALWSKSGAVGAWHDPVTVWQQWADDVTGFAIPAGHFLPEEAPDDVLRYLSPFLRRATTGQKQRT